MFLVIKINGSVLIIVSCFSIGYLKAKNLYIRRDFLSSFIKYLSVLSTNIRYNSDDIFSIVNLSAKTEDLNCFEMSKEDNVSFEEYWKNKITSLDIKDNLLLTDKTLLSEFGSQLGKKDIEGELQHIELYKRLFEKQLQDAENQIVKKSKLYKVMGFFVGTATALVIN